MSDNKDIPAMPCTKATGEVFEGLTKREMFAMHAPHVEPRFAQDFAKKNKDNSRLVVIFKSENCYQLTLIGEMQLIKEWRYAYADMMLETKL